MLSVSLCLLVNLLGDSLRHGFKIRVKGCRVLCLYVQINSASSTVVLWSGAVIRKKSIFGLSSFESLTDERYLYKHNIINIEE